MIGFLGTVSEMSLIDANSPNQLPLINFCKNELSDVRWFKKSVVRKALQKQFGVNYLNCLPDSLLLSESSSSSSSSTMSSSLSQLPLESLESSQVEVQVEDEKIRLIEENLKFPGPTSLSRVLITSWCVRS